MSTHKDLHDTPTELCLHISTEFAAYFRVIISLNLGVKLSWESRAVRAALERPIYLGSAFLQTLELRADFFLRGHATISVAQIWNHNSLYIDPRILFFVKFLTMISPVFLYYYFKTNLRNRVQRSSLMVICWFCYK